MSTINDFVNMYYKQSIEGKGSKVTKTDIKNVCDALVEYIKNYSQQVAQENDITKNKGDKKISDIVIFVLHGFGRFVLQFKKERKMNFKGSNVSTIPARLVLKFKPSAAIKKTITTTK